MITLHHLWQATSCHYSPLTSSAPESVGAYKVLKNLLKNFTPKNLDEGICVMGFCLIFRSTDCWQALERQ
jgi:hypothetical protein